MVRIAIASPFEVWSAGLQSVLRSAGVTVTGCYPSISDHASLEFLQGTELVVIAWQCVLRSRGVMSPRPIARGYDGKLVLVLEPDDEPTEADFAAMHPEGLMPSWASIEEFSECLRTVSRGSRWVHPWLQNRALQEHGNEPCWESLSGREHEVALLAASGQSNKVIARALGLSDGTIKIHMHHVLSKLHLRGRGDLAQWSRQQPGGGSTKSLI